MRREMHKSIVLSLSIAITASSSSLNAQSGSIKNEIFKPLSYELAESKADSVLRLMTQDEMISYISGDRSFFIRPVSRLNLPEVYMADATQGVHIREKFRDVDLSKYQLEKSTAFPCPILLAAAWNSDLAFRYAEAVGEECRGGNIGILLGPGMNQYRHSQCGRNFEYFGEDPYLRSILIGEYVKGVQSTGTIATLKHFAANNTEYFRRRSNSIIDERTLHEIYLPPFKAGIDAGAMAVMTSYNQLNGEWCGESEYAIRTILRKQLGFKWLVMTDWWSVSDGEKVIKSGQDLEMPMAIALEQVPKLIGDGKVPLEDIRRMAKSIMRTYLAMHLDEQRKKSEESIDYQKHELIALQTAREGIVLLKNDNRLLPLSGNNKSILVTGEYVEKLAKGGGAAEVKGYNIRLMVDELRAEFGKSIQCIENPSIDQIRSSDVVICNVGTDDREGRDRSFGLPAEQERKVLQCVQNNPNTVVIVSSGSGIRMTDWNEKAKAILYSWYVGQNGNKALVEILAGKTNPSGKLPITIEKEFKDSPGFGYIPEGESIDEPWTYQKEREHPVYDIRYTEGIFSGYRWYEKKKIEPLYPFGFGLSYTTFEYSDLKVSKEVFNEHDALNVSVAVKNTGKNKGAEIVQLYIQDVESSVPRPVKELKSFKKVELESGQSTIVSLELSKKDFSFWNPETKDWFAEKGAFVIQVGSSSRDIKLQKHVELE
jgi:beta-glucosidase